MGIYAKFDSQWRGGIISPEAIIKKGNLAVLATAEFRDGQMISSPAAKQRYVWPNPYNHSNAGFINRRVYSR